MSKVDKDVAAMLKNLNKLDRANKTRLMENISRWICLGDEL